MCAPAHRNERIVPAQIQLSAKQVCDKLQILAATSQIVTRARVSRHLKSTGELALNAN